MGYSTTLLSGVAKNEKTGEFGMSSGQSPFDFSQYNGSQTQDQTPTVTERSDGGPQGNVDWSSGVSGFGSSPAALDSVSPDHGVVAAPVLWLYSAFAAAVVSLGVASLLGTLPAAAISAWVLGGPIAIALVAAFTLNDTKSRTFPLYSASQMVPWLYRFTVAASLAAVAASAWGIANWAGRL